jgi:tyrosyl-tRNA synthetase
MHPALVELEKRGLINQSTDIEVLSKLLESGKAVYCGFDPTADSLHVGSLLPLTVLKLFKEHGVPIVAVVGGGTGSIGDPSFKSEERVMMDKLTISRNVAGLTSVIRSVLGDDNVIITNNESWMKEINMLDFLRGYGKCFSVNNMMNKDSVRSRLERPEQGISFTEFSYPILQALDFEYLFSILDCAIQIGGSDQWGNMIAGIDVIHKMHGNDAEVGVITLPLVTKDDGTKFGKSESGTVWLSPNKTTPFEYFQFWMNISDSEMIKLYQYFQPLSFTVEQIKREMQHEPMLMKKQFAIAMTQAMHGSEKTTQAINIAEFLFGKRKKLSTSEIEMMINAGMEVHEVVEELNFVDILISTGLAPSKKMSREFIMTGAAKVNGTKINEFFDPNTLELFENFEAFDDRYFILQRGRDNYVIIHNRRR